MTEKFNTTLASAEGDNSQLFAALETIIEESITDDVYREAIIDDLLDWMLHIQDGPLYRIIQTILREVKEINPGTSHGEN